MRQITKWNWQFSLKNALAAIGLINVALAVVVWAGLFGFANLLALAGVALVICGAVKRHRNYAMTGVALLITALVAMPFAATSVGMGYLTVPVTVEVVDDESGEPVTGVTVRLRDITSHGRPDGVPVFPVPTDEPGTSVCTDNMGIATLPVELNLYLHKTVFEDQSQIHVSPYLWIYLSTSGYETVSERLDQFVGSKIKYSRLPLSTTRIRLKRISPMPERDRPPH